MKRFWTSVAVLLMVGSLFAGEYTTKLNEAAASAKRTGKPILVDFHRVWCGLCKQFDRDRKRRPNINNALDSAIFVKIDWEQGDGIALAKKYGVTGSPTFVLLNEDLESIYQFSGYSGESKFLDIFNFAMKENITITDREKRFAANPTSEDAHFLAMNNYRRNNLEALAYFEKARELGSKRDLGKDIFKIKFSEFSRGTGTVSYNSLVNEAITVVEKGDDKAKLQVSEEMLMAMTMAGKERAEKARFVEIGLTITAQDPKAYGNTYHFFAMEDALLKGNKKAALAHRKAMLDPDWMTATSDLNEFSWWCFANNVNLKEARDLAEKGAAMALPGNAKGSILDTWAELENALGNPARALMLSRKALAEMPNHPALKKNVKRFEKLNEKNGKNKS